MSIGKAGLVAGSIVLLALGACGVKGDLEAPPAATAGAGALGGPKPTPLPPSQIWDVDPLKGETGEVTLPNESF